jgi:cytochrome c
MKKTLIVLSFIALASCGGGAGNKSASGNDTAVTAPASASTTISPDAEKALTLIGSSDCRTCHKINKDDATGGPIGPSYTDVAARYSPAADTTVDRIVKKVISGGMGVWGVVPMTPHPALSETDVRTIVKYILTQKK